MKKIFTLLLLLLSATITVKAQSIFCSAMGGAQCEGANFNLSYSVSGVAPAMAVGNVFTVQLSDSAGSFVSPVLVATFASTALNDTVVCTIPNGITSSGIYAIRVNSSDTALIGNSYSFMINKKPTAFAGADLTSCNNTSAINISASYNESSSFNWITLGGGTFLSNSVAATTYFPDSTDTSSGVNLIFLANGNGVCTATQDTMHISFTPAPTIYFAASEVNFCEGGSVGLSPNGTNIDSYLWSTGDSTSLIVFTATTSSIINVTGYSTSGCSATTSITMNVRPKPAMSVSVTHTTCGNATGTAFVSTSPSNSIFWQTGSNNDTISGLAANSYLVQVFDTAGCQNSAYATINNSDGPIITSTTTPTSCPSKCNGAATINVSGGTAPYTYAWSNGSAGNTTSASGICVGNYTVTVTDGSSCVSSAAISITSSGDDPLISGNVAIAGNPINSGVVELYRFNTTSLALTLINSAGIDANGNYSVASFIEGDYLIAATANSSTYPNAIKTYFVQENNWSDATTVSAGCNLSTLKNIDLINLAPLAGGNDTITGIIYNVLGGKTNTVGDPIPGIDVSLEQNPGSIMVAQTSTDASGKFNFADVPAGNYSLYVDIPGLGMTSSHNVTAGSGTEHADLNFYVDSATGISGTPPPTPVGISKASKIVNNSIRIYPNPFNEELSVTLDLKDVSTVSVELSSILGEKIISTEEITKNSGTYKLNIPVSKNLSSGIYILSTTVNGQKTVKKIVKE
ncbi:MAG: T9SS type A sorting domain-containing protein [Bacteroidota bacterium]